MVSRRCRSPPPTATPAMIEPLLVAGRRPEHRCDGRADGADDGGAHRQPRRHRGAASTRGADVTRARTWMGETALMWAAADEPRRRGEGAGEARRRHQRPFHQPWPIRRRSRRTRATTSPASCRKGQWTPLMYAAREGAPDAALALVGARRRRQRPGSRGRDAAARGDSQRPLRPRGAAAGQGRESRT